MELSRRLQAIGELVTPGYRVVDVGCDHGYLAISLVLQEKIPGAVAMDVRPGPLNGAMENIRAYGLEDYIETRLSDGLSAMEEAEGETLVIAGMGGPLMLRILREGFSVAQEFPQWILAPQSDAARFRRGVEALGRKIVRERLICEEGKYYPILEAVPGHAPYGDPIYYLYGKETLETKDPVLREFLQKERKAKEEILSRLDSEDTPGTRLRKEEILQELALWEKAWDYVESQ